MILQLAVRGRVVVVGDSRGELHTWEWPTNTVGGKQRGVALGRMAAETWAVAQICRLGPMAQNLAELYKAITSMALSTDFQLNHGCIYLSREPGVVWRYRMASHTISKVNAALSIISMCRATVGWPSDSTLLLFYCYVLRSLLLLVTCFWQVVSLAGSCDNGAGSSPSLLRRPWGGGDAVEVIKAQAHAVTSPPEGLPKPLIRRMTSDYGRIYIAWADCVYAFSESKNRVTARFENLLDNAAAQSLSRVRPDIGIPFCALISPPQLFLTIVNALFPGFCLVCVSPFSVPLDFPPLLLCLCFYYFYSFADIVACGEWLVIHCGPLVYCCDRRNFDDHPFHVLHLYRADAMVLRVSFVARHLLVCTEEADAHVCLSRVHLLDPQTLSPVDVFDLPRSAGRVTAAVYSQAQLTDGLSMQSSATHTFLLCPQQLLVVRVLKTSEQLLWLLRRRQFPLAMHLCQQRYRHEQVLLEVANLYACHLWRQGLCREAVRVWGEVHLPLAPPEYWRVFIDRLDAADKLDLVVQWLPFNDRTKVSSDMYQRLLTSPLLNSQYATVLARVSRWPVLYELPPLLEKILRLLDALSLRYSRSQGYMHATASIAPQHRPAVGLLLITLYKLYEFGNLSMEAAQVLLYFRILRQQCTALELVPVDWQPDDESYTFALRASVQNMEDNIASPAYFTTQRVFSRLFPAGTRKKIVSGVLPLIQSLAACCYAESAPVQRFDSASHTSEASLRRSDFAPGSIVPPGSPLFSPGRHQSPASTTLDLVLSEDDDDVGDLNLSPEENFCTPMSTSPPRLYSPGDGVRQQLLFLDLQQDETDNMSASRRAGPPVEPLVLGRTELDLDLQRRLNMFAAILAMDPKGVLEACRVDSEHIDVDTVEAFAAASAHLLRPAL